MARLKLLGPAVCERDGEPVREITGRQHPLAVLALLARAPSCTMTRPKIVGYLWPDVSESTARGRLSTHVHLIRRHLGDEALVSAGDEIRLNRQALACDVCEFEDALEAEAWDRAAELYEGPFLDGFRLKGSARFGKWLDAERKRLRQAHCDVLERLARRAERRGQFVTAVRWWRERVEEDRYDSRVVHRLMEALLAAGNKRAALRAARSHERLLDDELGTEPPEAVRDLARRIEADEVQAREPAAPAADTDGPAPDRTARDRKPPDRDPGATVDGPPPDPGERSEPPETDHGPRRLRPGHLLALALLLGGVAAGGWYFVGAGGETYPASRERSVAVLPFDVIGDRTVDPVAEGLHADLLSRLSNVSGLKVVSATSAESFRGAELPLPTIADSLGARWVVEGDVQQGDGRVRVNAQLIDARTDTHVWSATYDRDLTPRDFFRLQSDLTKRIARSLETELTPAEIERVERQPTRDLAAYRLYVRGRERLARRKTFGDRSVREAVSLFRRAIDRDSGFALAWAGLADAAAFFPADPTGSVDAPGLDQAAAARRALELDPDLAEAHASMGFVHLRGRDAPAALRRLRRALELKPSYAEAHSWIGEVYLKIGRSGKALEHLRLAVELSPRHAWARHFLYDAYLAEGLAEKSLAEARRQKRLGLEREGAVAGEVRALFRLGRLAEARRLAREQMETLGRGATWKEAGAVSWRQTFRSYLAVIRAAEGDTAGARQHIDRLRAVGAHPVLVGQAELARQRIDRALEAFARLEREDWGDIGVVATLRYGPLNDPRLLDPIRDDPRYRALIRTANHVWGLDPDGSLPTGEST